MHITPDLDLRRAIMGSGKAALPLAMPSPPGIGGASARFSILPESLAEQTGNLGQAVLQLMTAPAAGQNEAAETVAHRFEDIAHSFEQFWRASGASQSLGAAVGTAMRLNAEHAIRLVQDLAQAKGPLDAFSSQLDYMNAQAQSFAEIWRKEFSRLLEPQAAGSNQ